MLCRTWTGSLQSYIAMQAAPVCFQAARYVLACQPACVSLAFTTACYGTAVQPELANLQALLQVVVFTGLLKSVDSRDELAAVLAHEIAHVVARHHVRPSVTAGPCCTRTIPAGGAPVQSCSCRRLCWGSGGADVRACGFKASARSHRHLHWPAKLQAWPCP